jgi:hypothetical protein
MTLINPKLSEASEKLLTEEVERLTLDIAELLGCAAVSASQKNLGKVDKSYARLALSNNQRFVMFGKPKTVVRTTSAKSKSSAQANPAALAAEKMFYAYD